MSLFVMVPEWGLVVLGLEIPPETRSYTKFLRGPLPLTGVPTLCDNMSTMFSCNLFRSVLHTEVDFLDPSH